MTDTMRAAAVRDFGGVDQINVEQLSVPEPADGEVLVRVHAAGLNPIDNKFRSKQVPNPLWQSPEFPVIVGWDLSGTVVRAAGSFNEGDEVFGLVKYPLFAGACAEYSAAPVAHLAAKPANIDHNQAAGVPLAALTAWQAFETGGLKSDQTALIHAGAGGVGHFAIQIAKAMDVHVITTASARNEEFVKSLGADEFIDYTAADFSALVSGADFVFHTVDPALMGKSLGCVKEGGFLASISGQINTDDATAAGVKASFIGVRPDPAHLAAIAALIQFGAIVPHVDKTYPLAETAAAHAHVEGGHARGKVVVEIGG